MRSPGKIIGTAVMTAAILALFTSGSEAFGPLDPNFHPPFLAVPSAPGRAQLLPNGNYLLFFNIDTLTDQRTGAIIRFLPDGTLDTSFNFSHNYSGLDAVAPTSDGKLIISAGQTVYGRTAVNQILRLNANGSIDSTFTLSVATGDVRNITLQPDGRVLVAGFFNQFAGQNRPGIVRLLANGSLDTSFVPVSIEGGTGGLFGTIGTGPGVWARPAVQSDGKILIGGDFTLVNNTNCPGIARLNSNGTLDTTFNASGYTRDNNAPIRGIVVQSNGKIVIGGRLTVNYTSGVGPLARLNSNGSIDSTFAFQAGFFAGGGYPGGGGRLRDLVQQTDGKLLPAAKRIVRFNADGSIDNSFHEPVLLVYRDNAVNFPEAFTVNLQSDGHILIGGDFTDIDDAPPNPPGPSLFGVARLNSDGTVDNTLTTTHETGSSVTPISFARQLGGLTLIALNLGFTYNDAAIPHNFGRLMSDGTLDTSFDPLASLQNPFTALGFTTLTSGNIFVFGNNYQSVPSVFVYNVLTPGGTVVNPNYTNDPSVSFDKAYPQPLTSGQVLVLSSASAQSIVNNTQLQRLNSDGSRDASFVLDPNILTDTVQRDINGNITTVAASDAVLATLPTGKILFSYLAADSTYRLVQLNSNGSVDSTFQAGSVPASTTPSSVLVHDPQTNTDVFVTVLSPNGVPGFSDAQVVGSQILLVGQFASYAGVPAHGIVRLNGDGTVDGTFQSGNGAQWTQTVETTTFHPSVDNIEQAGNAKLLITGSFEAFNGVSYPGIALLNPNGSLDTSFVPPATRQKFDYHTAYLGKQSNSSFLLSGPYSFPDQTPSPSFIHIFGAPIIMSPTTATATQNQLFAYQVFATGIPISYTATPLPAGLTFDSVRGVIGGTPTNPGTTQIQLTASNSFGTGTATLTLTVQPAPNSGPIVMSGTSLTGRTGEAFSFEVFTTGGSSTARLSATGLPPGLSVDPVTGIISGTPTTADSFGVTLTVTDGGVSNTFTLELTFTSDPAVPVIISPREAALAEGQSFSYTVDAPGDPSEQTTFSLIGNLPPGLGFDPATGTISGTYNPLVHQNGGSLLGNVQLIATNSSGSATNPLSFFQAVSATAKNISTRLAVGTVDNVLIGGFIVTGNAPKKVIVRAIGPSLTALGVPGAMQNPTLELHDHTGALIAKNDNWQTTEIYGVITANQSAAIQASTLAPTDYRESAMLVTLAQNNGDPTSLTGHYTAIVKGANNTTGVALVEVYDLGTASLDTTSNAQLANISTRGLVQTGDNVMIGGFIVQGDMRTTVIVRAIGPSLANAGITNPLQDPTLELYNGTGAVIKSNDNWQNDPGSAQIQANNLAPSDPRESATIVTLDPGNYTAIVHGANGTTGVALVETYVLQ